MIGHGWSQINSCDPWLIRLLGLRCQCSQWQRQGRTTARALRSQSSTPPFSKALIRPRACPPPLLPPHRSTLQPTTSLVVVPMMHTGRVYTSLLCVYMSVRVFTYKPDLKSGGNTSSVSQLMSFTGDRSSIVILYTNNLAQCRNKGRAYSSYP